MVYWQEVRGHGDMRERYTIGVLIGNANSPHSIDLMQGIYHAAEKLGMSVLFFLGIHSDSYYYSYFGDNAGDDYDYQFNVVYDYAPFGRVDALIISYGTMGQYLEQDNKELFLEKFHGIPYVLLEERDSRERGMSLIADNYHGMYEIAEHLVRDHGYRKITYLAGPRGNTDAKERMAAVRDVMRVYGIPFDENHIEYGDYTACVEAEVNRLLDRHPDMDAMICANDVMADTVYKECAARGLVVGRDIAVTGYDDWEVAASMNPPLTTVLQNAYDMGYMALIGALKLLQGSAARTVVVPAHVKYRGSCGCDAAADHKSELTEEEVARDWEDYCRHSIVKCVEMSLLANASEDIRMAVEQNIRRILRHDFRKKENHDAMLLQLKVLLSSSVGQYISAYSLMQALISCMDEWIRRQLQYPDETWCDCLELMELKEQVQETIMVHIVKTDKDRFSMFQQETWFLPLIARDMMNHINDEKEFYYAAMQKLSALKARNSYLYIFEEPIRHPKGSEWRCPEKLYLAAFQEGTHVTAYAEEDWPVLTGENGFSSFYSGGRYAMSIFCLFSGETQYGILVTEIHPSNLALSYLISMEIGNALKFHELSREQRRTSRELESLVEEIREKNEVLNFISEYDPLTRILNRRGFMERAVRFNREHSGQQAGMIFVDLDHLKQINDCFGHLEGDFALKCSAEAIQSAVPELGIVGRIGGDEFAVLIPGGKNETEQFIQRVQDTCARFNTTSEKDYYVEVSMGCEWIVCSEELVLSEVLKKADEALYHAKENRRASVWKDA